MKFNESNDYQDLKNMLQTIEDICSDLKEESEKFNIEITPKEDIQIKIVSLYLNVKIEFPGGRFGDQDLNPTVIINIPVEFTGSDFVKGVSNRIINYVNSQGFIATCQYFNRWGYGHNGITPESINFNMVKITIKK